MPEQERRGAPRYQAPEGVTAEIAGVPVRLCDLSAIGAKVEHGERFTLSNVSLTIHYQGQSATLASRIARSEIVGRRAEGLIYRTGLYFTSPDGAAQGFIAQLLRNPQPATQDPPKTGAESLDDTWTRQVRFLRNEPEESLPYAQFRLTPSGWQKSYVASPAQPSDGFTIARERHDFDELARSYEFADPETRKMIKLALERELTT